MLKVKSIFGVTIQGEGKQSGFPSIFIRFAGCNIWDGREETRLGNICHYCDTDFRGGDFMNPVDIVVKVNSIRGTPRPLLVVITGGEPLLQPSKDLTQLLILLRSNGYLSQLETNGTQWSEEVIRNIDFVTVSPKKPKKELKVNFAKVNCLKILHPHLSVKIEEYAAMARDPQYRHIDFCIQPIQEGNEAKWEENTKDCVSLVKALGYPWRLSLQTHKFLGEE